MTRQVHVREPRVGVAGGGHEFEHTRFEACDGVAQHATRVAQAPGIGCIAAGFGGVGFHAYNDFA
ncbi:hypothetical protein D9M68_918770 [compost metagenome]